jgi:hypothetical protein
MVKNEFVVSNESVFMDALWKEWRRDLRDSKDKKMRELGRILRRIEKGTATKEDMRIFLTDKMLDTYNAILSPDA